MLNEVVLIGRLTADIELRYTAGKGTPVTNFNLAVDRPYTNQDGERGTDFISITVWGRQAENCAQYIGKGSLVAVTGRLEIDSYEDNEGIKRKTAKVIANNVRFLNSRKKEEDAF